MKHCPKCRVESRNDADWCWHCGYSYEEAEPEAPPETGTPAEASAPDDAGDDPPG
jgi:hypothetical protein